MYIYRSWKKFVTTHNNRTSHQSEVLHLLQFSASKFLSNSSAKSKLNFHGYYDHILTRSWEWNLLVFNKTQFSVTKSVHKERAHVFGFFHAWILCSLLNFCDPCSRVCAEQINICSEIAQNRLSVWWWVFSNLSALKCTEQIVCLMSFLSQLICFEMHSSQMHRLSDWWVFSNWFVLKCTDCLFDDFFCPIDLVSELVLGQLLNSELSYLVHEVQQQFQKSISRWISR